MRLFGFEITRRTKGLNAVSSRRGWWPIIREPYAGAWQRNDEISAESKLAYYAVYACISLISQDIGKLFPEIRRKGSEGIWDVTQERRFSPLLEKPNRYQNYIQFKEWWATSKLSRGNTYVLKERDDGGNIKALYVLDGSRVQPLVADDGSIYYQLFQDNLNSLEESVIVPASEIIHDRMCCLFHPLVGVPPLFASGLAASQGLRIQQDSSLFFANGARPSGILTAPGAISDETARRMKEEWEQNYTGKNSGKVAVLGDGLKFESMSMSAVDSQLIEQLRITAEMVCATYHVPPFKIGIGSIPSGQKVEDLNLIYYSDCLQSQIEAMEVCLDEGLSMPNNLRVELDLYGLLRMDTASLFTTLGAGVKAAVLSPNEARRRVNLKPQEGGNSVYMQQQNYSLEALARRDTSEDPFGTTSPQPTPEDTGNDEERAILLAHYLEKELNGVFAK